MYRIAGSVGLLSLACQQEANSYPDLTLTLTMTVRLGLILTEYEPAMLYIAGFICKDLHVYTDQRLCIMGGAFMDNSVCVVCACSHYLPLWRDWFRVRMPGTDLSRPFPDSVRS